MNGGWHPLAKSLAFEREREVRQLATALQHDELPELERGKIERNDRERVGIERHHRGQGQVDAERDSEQRARGELHGVAAGNQAREKPDRDAACDRPPVQVPQIVVLEPGTQPRDVAVAADGFVAR
jgi:hypothetical protein